MITPADPQLPRVLDDVWEPPPRSPRRLLAIIATTGVLVAGALIVTIRGGWEHGDPMGSAWTPQRVSASHRTLWYPDSVEARWPSSSLAAPRPAAAQPLPPPPPPPPPPPRAPSAPGYLSVNSRPWAQVAVDGRIVGNTPQLGIRLTPGRHYIGLARHGFAAYGTWVNVDPGATVKITGVVLKRIAP